MFFDEAAGEERTNPLEHLCGRLGLRDGRLDLTMLDRRRDETPRKWTRAKQRDGAASGRANPLSLEKRSSSPSQAWVKGN